MSAWIVGKSHINLLVSAALNGPKGMRTQDWKNLAWRPIVVDGSENAVGQMLVDECVKSVSHRYPDDDVSKGELPGPCDAYYLRPYEHFDHRLELSVPEILKLLACYSYQSCEHPDWKESAAFRWCKDLEEMMMSSLWNNDDKIPWGWYDKDIAARGGRVEPAAVTA